MICKITNEIKGTGTEPEKMFRFEQKRTCKVYRVDRL